MPAPFGQYSAGWRERPWCECRDETSGELLVIHGQQMPPYHLPEKRFSRHLDALWVSILRPFICVSESRQ